MNNQHPNDLMAQMFQQAKAQFGKAIKAYWFNDGDACPGCGSEIDNVNFKGEAAISLNAFIYRERGVLIGYFLCSRCVERVFRYAKQNPHQQTELHTTIEKNLIQAYQKHIRSMDA
ncbi:MAG: hypothetical protein KJ638_01375 [Chloroflexi bacterium]|nr:hypothetical protein [Chloroflexota bacterium]